MRTPQHFLTRLRTLVCAAMLLALAAGCDTVDEDTIILPGTVDFSFFVDPSEVPAQGVRTRSDKVVGFEDLGLDPELFSREEVISATVESVRVVSRTLKRPASGKTEALPLPTIFSAMELQLTREGESVSVAAAVEPANAEEIALDVVNADITSLVKATQDFQGLLITDVVDTEVVPPYNVDVMLQVRIEMR